MDLFISHASDDKEEIARPLAQLLRERGFSVWYDEFALTLGDNLRRSLDEGLRGCRFGVVILSPRFLEKAWTQQELDSLITREMASDGKVILPVWHHVTQTDVLRYSPALANRISVSTDEGLERVVQRIEQALRKSGVAPTGETPQSSLEQYEIMRTIHEGHYGRVYKCRVKATGEVCIIKSTIRERVSWEALERLRSSSIPNLAKPRAIWDDGRNVFEVLPYVGGIRLSQAVTPGIGELSGFVLETCHEQLMETLSAMHAAGVVHRDVHPENVYMVIERDPGPGVRPSVSARTTWKSNDFGTQFVPFRIAWVLVDCSFACLADVPSPVSFRHGTYTPGEQEVGNPSPASDMYALGATIYYCITGEELPSYRQRQKNPDLPARFPSGGHPSVRFADHLERLVSLDPDQRPKADVRLHGDTVAEGFTGVLRVSDDVLLLCNHFDSFSRLANRRESIAYFEKMVTQWPYTESWYNRTPGDAFWWLAALHGQSSRA